MLIFLTDGLPTVGETNPEAIADLADRLRGQARVFAFGVGYDVDTYLLDRLTMAGRGGVQYVGPGEDVERALGLLAMKIQHPVLAELEWGRVPVRISEVYPTELPDLFVGEELTVFGRYADAGRGELSIDGEREGRVASFSAEVVFSEHETENEFIPRLWAARKIGELTREVRVNGSHPELIDEIRQTALRYGILTEYTSYLVLEPDMIAGEGGLRPPEVRQELPRAGRDAVLGAAAASRAREANRVDDVAEMERMALDAAQVQTTATLASSPGRLGRSARCQGGTGAQRRSRSGLRPSRGGMGGQDALPRCSHHGGAGVQPRVLRAAKRAAGAGGVVERVLEYRCGRGRAQPPSHREWSVQPFEQRDSANRPRVPGFVTECRYEHGLEPGVQSHLSGGGSVHIPEALGSGAGSRVSSGRLPTCTGSRPRRCPCVGVYDRRQPRTRRKAPSGSSWSAPDSDRG